MLLLTRIFLILLIVRGRTSKWVVTTQVDFQLQIALKRNVPHLACVSTEFVLIEKVRVCKVYDKHRSLSKHTTNEYELLTHTKQGAVHCLATT